MIVSSIFGGLGNQMFQYAYSKKISIDNNIPLYFYTNSISPFHNNHNGFELSHIFNINNNIASNKQLSSISLLLKYQIIRFFILNSNLNFSWLFRESKDPSINFNKKFNTNTFIYGYWQNPNYFTNIKEQLISDFMFTRPLVGKNKDLQQKLLDEQSVSIHIRRGDYVKNKNNINYHGTCSVDYYTKAIEYINHSIPGSIYYVFSDDIDWVNQNLLPLFPYLNIVNNNHGSNSYIDMQLMSLCKNNIIANSTFSWWSAWLNSNADKIVIAPSKWFANDASEVAILPNSWIKI